MIMMIMMIMKMMKIMIIMMMIMIILMMKEIITLEKKIKIETTSQMKLKANLKKYKNL